MFINSKPPNIFVDGESLSPEDINENNKYFIKAFKQAADKQTCRWTSTYELVPNVSTTLSNVTITRKMPDSAYRAITATPVVVIESISINVYYTSTVAFTMTLASGDIITFPIRSSDLALEPYQVVKLTNYSTIDSTLFTVTIPSTATVTKFDVTVGFSSDRYLSGNYTAALTKPSLSLVPALNYTGTDVPLFNDFNSATSYTFSNMKTVMETAATNAVNGAPYRWAMAEFRNLTSTSDGFYTSKPIPCYADPSFSSVTSAARIIGSFAYIEFSGAPAGSTVTFGLADNTGGYVTALRFTGTMGTGTGTVTLGQKATYANSIRYTAVDNSLNDRLIKISSLTAGATIDYAAVYILLQ